MDVKASARSKRASSQRGRARHSHHHHKQQQHQHQQPHQQQRGKHGSESASASSSLPTSEVSASASQLPSNWSRYEDEDDEDEGAPQALTGLPPPKSKGADYRELLLDQSPSSIPDIWDGRKSMMFTRGMDFLTQGVEADRFWQVGDSSGDEVPYFSLDLDFLAKELMKVDLAERLFLDPKYIPLELREENQKLNCTNLINEQQDAAQYQSIPAVLQHDQIRFENDAHDLPSLGNTMCDVGSMHETCPIQAVHVSLHANKRNPMVTFEAFKGCSHRGDSPRGDLPSLQSEENSVVVVAHKRDAGECSHHDAVKIPQVLSNPELHNKVLRGEREEYMETDANKFEPQAAEAELDALLDMLDSQFVKGSSTSSNAYPTTMGIETTNSHGATALLEVFQKSDDLSEDAFLKSSKSSDLKFSDEEGSRLGGPHMSVPPIVTPSVKGSSDTLEDFDDWLDSL